MAVNPDFKDLLLALSAAQARFLVVGAYAVNQMDVEALEKAKRQSTLG